MTTLVKLAGLDRGDALSRASTGRVTANTGFRVASGTFKQDIGAGSVKAFLTIGAGNAGVTYTANWAGASGNGIQVAHVTGGTATPAITVTYAAGTGLPTITATQTGAVTAATVQAAVNADPVASQYVTATLPGTGASAFTAAAAAPLATGANGTVPNLQPVYFNVNSSAKVVVDVDDTTTRKMLRRNTGRFISLGQP